MSTTNPPIVTTAESPHIFVGVDVWKRIEGVADLHIFFFGCFTESHIMTISHTASIQKENGEEQDKTKNISYQRKREHMVMSNRFLQIGE